MVAAALRPRQGDEALARLLNEAEQAKLRARRHGTAAAEFRRSGRSESIVGRIPRRAYCATPRGTPRRAQPGRRARVCVLATARADSIPRPRIARAAAGDMFPGRLPQPFGLASQNPSHARLRSVAASCAASSSSSPSRSS